MKKYLSPTLVLLALIFLNINTFAQWEVLHPGAGGQVQYIYPEPKVEGRVYYLSDMEGMYRSDNYGKTWNFQGEDFVSTQVYVMISDPKNPEILYAGTNLGLHKSTNGGKNWKYLTGHNAPKTEIATLAIDPKNPNTIFAGVCWHEDDIFVHEHKARGIVYCSLDGGTTWKELIFEPDTIYRQVFSIAIHPENPDEIYLGADRGIYHSSNNGENWELISPPAESKSGKCRGIAITPDGKYIYATFAVTIIPERDPLTSVYFVKETDLYLSEIKNIAWHNLSAQLVDPHKPEAKPDFWRPAIDPRSTGNSHRILMGPLCYGNYGLFEGTITIDSKGIPSAVWEKVFDNNPQKGWLNEYDYGWNNLLPAARHYTYSPASWKERKIWLGSQQSVYEGDGINPKSGWNIKSTQKASEYLSPETSNSGKTVSYTNTGIVSTFNYDMNGDKNYVVQGMGDNGILESWDGGESWTQRIFDGNRYYNSIEDGADWWMDNGDSFLIIPTSPKILLAGMAPGFGGGPTNNGYLIGIKLENYSPADQWKHLAGGSIKEGKENGDGRGTKSIAGLPRQRIYCMDSNPSNINQVVVGTSQGIYMIDNVSNLFDEGKGEFYDISDGLVSNHSFNSIAFDPNTPDVFYASSRAWNNTEFGQSTDSGKVWKVTRINNKWNWKPIYHNGAAGNEAAKLAVWDYNKTTMLAITDNCAVRENRIKFSEDKGETWKTVLTYNDALFLPREGESKASKEYKHSWYLPEENNLLFGAISGFENQIFITFSQHQPYGKGYALIKGTISNDRIDWCDWTGSYEYGQKGFFAFPHARRTRVLETNGKNYLYVSTMGMGLWRRPLK